jgi:hypothetical protein
MELRTERRLLQMAVAIACLVPFAAGLAGIVQGAAMIGGVRPPVSTDLDSHFRYLSGLLLGVGLGFAACIPRIERARTPFAALSAIVIVGGLARLLSLAFDGVPGPGHVFGLAMELGAVPLLFIWHRSLALRFAAAEEPALA